VGFLSLHLKAHGRFLWQGKKKAIDNKNHGDVGWETAEVEKRISPLRRSQKRERLRSK